jgi:hypothetical protein
MRTTVRLDPHLLAEAKRLAAATGRTLTSVIEESLRSEIARRRHPARKRDVKLTIVDGRGLRPGIDLDDTGALLDEMDGYRGPA